MTCSKLETTPFGATYYVKRLERRGMFRTTLGNFEDARELYRAFAKDDYNYLVQLIVEAGDETDLLLETKHVNQDLEAQQNKYLDECMSVDPYDPHGYLEDTQ